MMKPNPRNVSHVNSTPMIFGPEQRVSSEPLTEILWYINIPLHDGYRITWTIRSECSETLPLLHLTLTDPPPEIHKNWSQVAGSNQRGGIFHWFHILSKILTGKIAFLKNCRQKKFCKMSKKSNNFNSVNWNYMWRIIVIILALYFQGYQISRQTIPIRKLLATFSRPALWYKQKLAELIGTFSQEPFGFGIKFLHRERNALY